MYTLDSQDEEHGSLVIVSKDGNSGGSLETISCSDIVAILEAPSWTSDSRPDAQKEHAPMYYMLCISSTPPPVTDASSEEQRDETKGATNPYSLRHLGFQSLPSSLLDSYLVARLPPHLTVSPDSSTQNGNSASTLNLTILVSTASGTRLAPFFYHSILSPTLSALGLHQNIHYTTLFTSSEDSITDFTTTSLLPNALNGIKQTVLLLSGDGGIVDIINGLFAQRPSTRYVKPTICLLPLGTGNALANSSRLNTSHTKGLQALLRGTPKPIPTFTATFSRGSVLLVDEGRKTQPLPLDEQGRGLLHGAVVASWALHASLVADSDTAAYRRFGAERFAMAAGELLDPADGSASHRYRGKVTTFYCENGEEGEEVVVERAWERREHMYILATMVSNLEAALRISPASKTLDGVLRVVSWKPLQSGEVKRILGLAFEGGRHVGCQEVEYEAVEGVRIEVMETEERWRRFCVDGKIVRVPEDGWVEVRREEREVVDLVVEEM